jgi:hypothetical protein
MREFVQAQPPKMLASSMHGIVTSEVTSAHNRIAFLDI